MSRPLQFFFASSFVGADDVSYCFLPKPLWEGEMCCYENYIVGYLDLLGARSRIGSDSDGAYLQTVHDCCEKAKMSADFMSSAVNEPFRSKIFSDNIVVALLCDEARRDDNHAIIGLNRMSTIVGALQRCFLEFNILSRGSITYGNLFIDDTIVFGDALIEAYDLESKSAIFPRVILSRKVRELNMGLSGGEEASIGEFRTDVDGLPFVDYLNYPKDPMVQSVVAKSLCWVNGEISGDVNETVLQKLMWHKHYLESFS